MASSRFFIASLALVLTVANSALAQSLLPRKELTIKGISVQAEIASTHAARQKGLMFRERLPQNHGMLFVFEAPGIHCFWMKNTPLPLSIAFIDTKGVIQRISNMTPHDEATHCPPTDVLYALEMEQGWFQKYDITTGTKIEALPKP